MACLEGIEPPTYGLEGRCSIRLSYRQKGLGLHNVPELSKQLNAIGEDASNDKEADKDVQPRVARPYERQEHKHHYVESKSQHHKKCPE